MVVKGFEWITESDNRKKGKRFVNYKYFSAALKTSSTEISFMQRKSREQVGFMQGS
jgi:hypothetical protein